MEEPDPLCDFTSFLFGNIDANGCLEDDVLDEDCKKHINALGKLALTPILNDVIGDNTTQVENGVVIDENDSDTVAKSPSALDFADEEETINEDTDTPMEVDEKPIEEKPDSLPTIEKIDPLDEVEKMDPLDVVEEDSLDVVEKDSLDAVEKIDTLNVVEKDSSDAVEKMDTLNVVEKDSLDAVGKMDSLDAVEKTVSLDAVEKKDSCDVVEKKDSLEVAEKKNPLEVVEKKDPLDVVEKMEEESTTVKNTEISLPSPPEEESKETLPLSTPPPVNVSAESVVDSSRKRKLQTPLAAMLPEKYANIDVREFFAEFREGKVSNSKHDVRLLMAAYCVTIFFDSIS